MAVRQRANIRSLRQENTRLGARITHFESRISGLHKQIDRMNEHAASVSKKLTQAHEEADARRNSLVQEIRGVLQSRGFFASNKHTSDLIGDVARAVAKAREES